MKKLLSLLIAACTAISLQAQKAEEKETKEILFRISSIYKKGDSLFAFIKGGNREGIEKGLFGKCINLYRPNVLDSYTEIASCKINYANDTMAIGYVQLYKTNSSKDSIRKGDLVALNVSIPKKESRSLLFDLAALDIVFGDMYKQNMYSISTLIYEDNKALEDSTIAQFVKDIKQTYEDVKDLFDDTSAIKQPMKEGRYKGKNVLDVMRDVTPADVRAYLLFVKSYPFKYMGYNYKANETFATWVLNTAYTSPSELQEMILSRNFNETYFQKLIAVYKQSIIKDKITETLVEKAVELFNENRKAESTKLFEQTKKLVTALNDTAGKASYYLNLAQVEQDSEKYKEAIALAEEALKYAVLAGNKDYQLRSLFKKTYCQYKLSDYIGGKATIVLAEKKLEEFKPVLKESSYLENLRKRFEYAGWINYSAGDYEVALQNLREAIKINNKVNTYSSKSNNASNYWYIGKTYAHQSKYKEALQVFDTSLAIYQSINSASNEGFIINEIGYIYFKMLDYDNSIKMHQKAYDILMPLKSYNNAGFSKSMIGQSLWNLKKYKGAIQSHEESIALRKKSKNHEGEAFSWEKLGDLYQLSGEKTKALAAFDSAAYHYGIIKDSASIAKNLNNIGKVYENDNDFKTATGYYEKALQFLKGIQDKSGQITTLFKLGYINFEVDSAKARAYFQDCLELSTETGDRSNQMYSLVNLGSLASNGSEIQKQQNYYEQALKLSKEINTADMEAYCYSRMAAGYERQLEFDKALAYYAKAKSIYDSVDKKEAIKHTIYAAHIEISKGEYDKAEADFNKAIESATISGTKMELADALTSSSFLYNLQGEFAKAIQATDSASAIYKSTGNNIKLASSFEAWGQTYKSLGEFAKSVQSYLTADSIYIAEKKEFYRQNVAINIGVTYFFQADYKKALEYFRKAETSLKNSVVDETYLLVKSNIAECLYYLKQAPEAEKILTSIYPLAKERNVTRIASGMGIVLGRIYYDKKEYDRASTYLLSAVEHGYKSKEKEKIIEALMYLGKVRIQQNKLEEAEKNLFEAATVTRKYKITSFGWESLYELGLFYYNHNKIDSAVTTFKEAVEIVERNAGNVYGGEEAKKLYKASEKKVDLYNKLVAALAKSGNTQDAWAYANKSNITAIKELQGTAVVNASNSEKTSAINGANNLLQQKAALDKSITELESKSEAEKTGQLQTLQQKKAVVEKEYLNYITSLIKKYPDLRLYFAQGVNPEQFKNYKNKLPNDVAAVLYLINDAQLLTFTVTNEKIGIKITDLKDDINKTLSEFISVLNVPGKSSGTGSLTLRSTILSEKKQPSGVSFTATSEKLYNLLLSDIEPDIKDKKRLCIIPSGKLCNIPFQCLGKRMPDSTFHFMVEDYSVFYTNTLDIFLNPDDPEKNFKSFTAFGNPDKTLKSAKTEVVEIGKILNTSNVFIEDMATEEKAKQSLSQNKYVHFATHGVLDYTDFSKSYLKFAIAKNTDDDGQLTIEEMKALDIAGCNLVMMSACETAVSQELQKGWYVSPANSLLINNVKSVVASLWQVDDEATSIFMKEFYKNVLAMSKVDALRKAQETLSKNPKYVHPFFWGAFVLYGDWR